MSSITKSQHQLLAQARLIYQRTPISEATERAYLATPRHLFVRRYREWASTAWCEVHEDNLEQHLGTLYADRSLTLFGDEDDDVPSTISQPSFVLRMLDLLELRPGHTVFELGTGSGWNAALMGQLVGPSGHVYSLEIIPDLARRAGDAIAALGLRNVHVVAADAGDGYAAGGPYDRGIFTAGTYDLPRSFYTQIKTSGLLLVIIKNEGGGDTLFLMRKADDHFESTCSMPCSFVPVRGKYTTASFDPMVLESDPSWTALRPTEVARRPFWWGGKDRESFVWRTMGIRSFLGITDPLFRAFKGVKTSREAADEHYFGIWDREHASLVLARDDELISYGNLVATERLERAMHQWVELGMPTAASFRLQTYPSGHPLVRRAGRWVVSREQSQFVWSL